MNDNFNTRMILTTAVFAAVAALLAGPAAAVTPEDPAIGTAFAARESDRNVQQALAETGPIPYLSHGIGVDESQFSGQPSVGLTGDSELKVDRAVAVANEAFDAYRVKSALEARQSLFEDQQSSVGLTGDSALTRDDVLLSSTTQAVRPMMTSTGRGSGSVAVQRSWRRRWPGSISGRDNAVESLSRSDRSTREPRRGGSGRTPPRFAAPLNRHAYGESGPAR